MGDDEVYLSLLLLDSQFLARSQEAMSHIPDDINIQPFPAETVYELRISGHLGQPTLAWFEDLNVTVDRTTSPSQTVISGPMRDQAALYGLISRIRDLGLTLLSVNRVAQEKDQ